MRQSTLSASSSQKWSEPIIALGKGVPAYSTKYGCLTYCVAGVGESSGWLRLYPLFAEQVISSVQPVEKFDVIRVIYRHKRPERTRPESRKIYPEFVEKVDHIDDDSVRRKIIHQYTEPGTFLHDDSWRGRKTLGMIQPLKPYFLVVQGVPKVRFQCCDACGGHLCEVGELKKFDSVGRVIPETASSKLESRLESLRRRELRFVMGTDSRHPQRWLLISVHVIGAN